MDSKTVEYMEKRVEEYRRLQGNVEELERQKSLLSDAKCHEYYIAIGNNKIAQYRKKSPTEFIEDLIKAINAEIARVKQEMEEI